MGRWIRIALCAFALIVVAGYDGYGRTTADPSAAGYGYVTMGWLQEAARQFQLAADGPTGEPEDQLVAGLTLEAAGNSEGALNYLLATVAAAHASPELWGLIGDLYLRWGEVDRAEEAFQKALAYDDMLALPHRGLAQIAEARGDDEAARDHYRAALDVAPALPEIHLRLGRVLRRLGDGENALEHLSLARRMLPRDPAVHLELGELYAVLGRREQAIHALSRALQLDPGLRKAEYLLDRLRGEEGNR